MNNFDRVIKLCFLIFKNYSLGTISKNKNKTYHLNVLATVIVIGRKEKKALVKKDREKRKNE